MRMSHLFGATLRAAPGRVEAEGHQLLLRAGYVRQLGQGLFSLLPLGLRTIQKIEAVLRSEMAAVGGQELRMPLVHPADLWRASGRYDSVGPELVRLRDRRERDLVLAMTHEEVVADLCRTEVTSYRDLPRLVYQIQTKFRDDPRPRAGLIRLREFTMKDAYSLDADSAGLDERYEALRAAYPRIFDRCGLPAVAVGADVGAMGGTEAHEFMYLTPIGEDTLVLCDGCGYAANRQVATFAKPAGSGVAGPLTRVETPGTTTIDSLAAFLGIGADRTAKALFMATERDQPVVAVVRGDMDLNETKLANAVGATALRPMTGDEIAAIGAVAGYGSPYGVKGATVVVDDLVAASPDLVAGANEAGYHLRNLAHGRDYTADVVTDLAAAGDGHGCARCGQPLRTARGVEVGNIFKLGTKYADAAGATYVDPDGVARPVVMGSYGIGLDRLLACIAEEHRDAHGLRLPAGVAPYQVHLCRLGGTEETADRLYAELTAAGVEVLYDDRGERPGVQFADADLIGLPVRLTVGERALAQGGVEVRDRATGATRIVPVGEVGAECAKMGG